MQHDTVAHDDGVHVGVTGEFGEDPGRDLDGDRPLGDRTRPVDGSISVGVDDHQVFGSSCSGDAGGAVDECDQGMAGEEPLLLDRILRTALGHLLREHRFHGRGEFGGEPDPGDRIELPTQVPHPVDVDPRRRPHVAPLSGQPTDPVIGLDPLRLHCHPAGELLHRAGRGNGCQRIHPVEQLAPLRDR